MPSNGAAPLNSESVLLDRGRLRDGRLVQARTGPGDWDPPTRYGNRTLDANPDGTFQVRRRRFPSPRRTTPRRWWARVAPARLPSHKSDCRNDEPARRRHTPHPRRGPSRPLRALPTFGGHGLRRRSPSPTFDAVWTVGPGRSVLAALQPRLLACRATQPHRSSGAVPRFGEPPTAGGSSAGLRAARPGPSHPRTRHKFGLRRHGLADNTLGFEILATRSPIGSDPAVRPRLGWTAGVIPTLALVGSVGEAARLALGVFQGQRRLERPSLARGLSALVGAGLVATVVWAGAQEYLFLFSILPRAESLAGPRCAGSEDGDDPVGALWAPTARN